MININKVIYEIERLRAEWVLTHHGEPKIVIYMNYHFFNKCIDDSRGGFNQFERELYSKRSIYGHLVYLVLDDTHPKFEVYVK